ncbi:MAG: hypothetical protein R3174_13635 [Gammaproteobacteria bacterium]|nr:hypothetical protein [Gammaproteobacteria bacterium]
MINRLSRDQAVALYDSKFWRHLNMEERACFQLREERLCMPFAVFHQAVETCLQREVGAAEYLRPRRLLRELSRDAAPPAKETILELVPANCRTLLVA